MTDDRHALVTGGAGFIGSHLVDDLLDRGWRVTVLDNFDPFYARAEKESNLARHRGNERLRVIEADLRDEPSMRRVFDGSFDVVVHLAARAGIRPSIAQPLEYQDVNVRGTHALLELCRQHGVRQFVFASSSSVYGVNPRVPWREDDHVLLPISPYASTKVSGELLGHVYASLYGLRFIALRFFTVYGPRQRPDLAIRKFSELMLAGEPIPVFGAGGTRRDYTYVSDIVDGIRAAMSYEATPYEVINLGDHRAVTLDELITGLERALGVTARITRLRSNRATCRRRTRTSRKHVTCSATRPPRLWRRAWRTWRAGYGLAATATAEERQESRGDAESTEEERKPLGAAEAPLPTPILSIRRCRCRGARRRCRLIDTEIRSLRLRVIASAVAVVVVVLRALRDSA